MNMSKVMSANNRILYREVEVAHARYIEACNKLKESVWVDALWQEHLWRRGADCNLELLREKGIAPPEEEA